LQRGIANKQLASQIIWPGRLPLLQSAV